MSLPPSLWIASLDWRLGLVPGMVAVVVLCSGADDLDKVPDTGIG